MNIHSSITHNSQKTETQMSINWWIGELNVMYPCSWILFGNRRERNFHPHCIKDDTWKHSKWKWSHVVWLFCMIPLKWNVPSRQVYGDWKWMNGCRELGEDEESLLTSTGFLSGEMKVFQNWLWWWLHNFEYTKHHWTEYFKWDELYSMQNYV